jgi:hypothetical protein
MGYIAKSYNNFYTQSLKTEEHKTRRKKSCTITDMSMVFAADKPADAVLL